MVGGRTEAPTESVPRGAGVILALACAAEFMVVLDASIVNVALPAIRTDLELATGTLQWVVNAYALPFAGLLLLGGRLVDLAGTRTVFSAGIVLFCGASLLGGLAPTGGLLIAARAVQGCGAALLAPASLAIVTATFPEGPGRVRALAAWTAVALAGGTAGNVLAGLITDALSWRWILLVNVPIGALAIVAATRVLRRTDHPAQDRTLDVRGAAAATLGIGALTYGVAEIRGRGIDDPLVAAPLIGGVLLLAGFVALERGAASPLVPARLIGVRDVAVGNVLVLLAGACLMPMWFFLTLLMQQVLGYSALQTGLAFLPHTLVAMLVGLRVAPWVMARTGPRPLIAGGALLAAAGFAWQSTAGPGSGYVAGILGPAIAISVGGGLLNTPLTTVATSGVHPDDAGAASGLLNTTKQVGGAVGLAAILLATTTDATDPRALADAYGAAFLIMAGVLVVTAAAAALLKAPVTGAVDPS